MPETASKEDRRAELSLVLAGLQAEDRPLDEGELRLRNQLLDELGGNAREVPRGPVLRPCALRIRVQGIRRPNALGTTRPDLVQASCHYRARRPWPLDGSADVEVLDQADDPSDAVSPPAGPGQALPMGTVLRTPDPGRIGHRSFEALKADARIRILASVGAPKDLAAALEACQRTAESLGEPALAERARLLDELERSTTTPQEV